MKPLLHTSLRRGGPSAATALRSFTFGAFALVATVSGVGCGSAPVTDELKVDDHRAELARLKRDIHKVDKSIDVTKDLIRRS